MRSRDAGFTLLELIIVVILVAVFFTVAIDRILPLRGDAEAAHVAATVGALRSALGVEVAGLIVHEGTDAVEELEGSNPFRVLAERPDNYLGEMGGVNPGILPQGAWYFDTDAGELVYLVRHTDYFRSDLDGAPRLAYRVELVRNERGELAGVRLAQVHGFVWTRSPELSEFLQQNR